MVRSGVKFAPALFLILVLTAPVPISASDAASGKDHMISDPLDDPVLPPWGYYKGILPNPIEGDSFESVYANASRYTQFVPVWGRPSPFYNLSRDLSGAWGDFFVDELIRGNGMFPVVHINFYGEGPTLLQPSSLPPSTLNSPAWRSLYLQSVKDVVNASRPKYLSLGNEVNRWFERYGNDSLDDNGFQHFVSLYNEAYDEVKLISPDTLVFCTFAREIVSENREANMSALEFFDPDRLDLIMLTSYPFSVAGINRVSDIEDDYYAGVLRHIYPKPFGLSEVSWTSSASFGGEDEQASFIQNLTTRLTKDQGLDLRFLGWNWLHDIGQSDKSGLVDQTGVPKKALRAWIDNEPPSYDRFRRTIEVMEDFGTFDHDLGMTFFDPDPWDILSYKLWNGTAYTNTTSTKKVSAGISEDTLHLVSVDNATGSVQIRVLVEDWSRETNWTLMLVNITPVNDPPGSKNPLDELVFSEGGSPFYDLSYYIYDVDDAFNTLELTILEAPGLNVTVNLANSPYMVLYTQEDEFHGDTHVSMRVSDPHGASAEFSIPVRILPINDPPVLTPPSVIILDEDIPRTLDLSAWAMDKDDPELDWNVSLSEGAGASLEIDGLSLTIIPEKDWFGSFLLTVNVSDGREFDAIDIPVIVTAVNDYPIVGSPGPISILEDQEFFFNLSDLSPTDPDGDTLYWYLDNASELIRSVAIYDNDTIRIRPLLDGHGEGSFTLRVQDGRGGVAYIEFTVDIEAVNDAPEFIVPEDWTLDIEIGASRLVDLRFVPYLVEDVDDPLSSLIARTDYPMTGIDGLVMNISVPQDTASDSFVMLVYILDPHGASSSTHELTIMVVEQNDPFSDLVVDNLTLSNPDGKVTITVRGRAGQTIWVVFTGTFGTSSSYRMTESTKDPGLYTLEINDPVWDDGTSLYVHLSKSRDGPNESGDLPIYFTYRMGERDVSDDIDALYPYLIGLASLLLLLVLVGVLVMFKRRPKVSDFDYGSLLEE